MIFCELNIRNFRWSKNYKKQGNLEESLSIFLWIRKLFYIAHSLNSCFYTSFVHQVRETRKCLDFRRRPRRVLRSSIKSPLSRNNHGREYRSGWINCKTAKIRPTYLSEMENGTPRHHALHLSITHPSGWISSWLFTSDNAFHFSLGGAWKRENETVKIIYPLSFFFYS